jgi:hypothetical protein
MTDAKRGPLTVFVDRRECRKPGGKPFVIAQDGIVLQHVPSLELTGRVRLRFFPRGIRVWDDERKRAGFVVHAYLEYWPDE